MTKLVAQFAGRRLALAAGNTDVKRDNYDARLQGNDAAGIVVNICSGPRRSVRSVLQSLRELTGHEAEARVAEHELRHADVRRPFGSNGRLRQVVGQQRGTDFGATMRPVAEAIHDGSTGCRARDGRARPAMRAGPAPGTPSREGTIFAVTGVATGPEQPSIRRSALLGLLAQVGPAIAILVVSPLLFGTLGAAKFGVLSIVLLTPQLALAADLGLLQASVRRYAGLLHLHPADVAPTVAVYSLSQAAVGVVVAGSIALSAPALSSLLGFDSALGIEQARRVITGCALWAALALAVSAPWALARAAQRFEVVAIVQTLATVGLWVGAAAIAVLDHPLHYVVVIGGAITALSALAYLAAMRARLARWSSLGEGWRLLWADRGFFAGAFQVQLASVVVYHLDRLLVAVFATPAAAGVYALCVNLANKLLFGVSSMTGFVFPRASSLAAAGQEEALRNVIRVMTRAVLCIVIPTLAPALLLAEPFFRAWVGTGFEPSMGPVFQALWLGFAVSAVTAPATVAWLGARGARLAAVFAWVSAATMVALLALLAPRWAEVGAAWAAFVALATSALFFAYVLASMGLARSLMDCRVGIGFVAGMGAQCLVLVATRSLTMDLAGVGMAAGLSFVVFFAVRRMTGTQTPEEEGALAWAASRSRKGSA